MLAAGCKPALNTFSPYAVLAHSDGNLYVATQANDRIYRLSGDGTGAATVVWDTNLTYINNPTALAEMPDGSLLVASDGTNSIERMSVDGTLSASGSFIRDGFTQLINQIVITPGQ